MTGLPREIVEDLLEKKNVRGVFLSPDRKGIVVAVREKLPEAELEDEDIVSERMMANGFVNEIDVVDCGGDFFFEGTRRDKHRPAPAGVSAGHPEITTGTLGSVPLIDIRGREVFLTNAHVAAPPDKVDMMDIIIQPGDYDDGTMSDDIGNVVDWSEIKKDETNKSDSALVKSYNLKKNKIYDLGNLHGLSTGYNEDTEFVKSGRTTGVTRSELIGVDGTVEVRGYYPNTTVEFSGVDWFNSFSSGGDSGSLICEWRDGDGRYGTHLLFAGSNRATIAIPMENVFEEHGVLEVKHKPGGRGGDRDNELSLWGKIKRWLGELLV